MRLSISRFQAPKDHSKFEKFAILKNVKTFSLNQKQIKFIYLLSKN